MRLDDRCHTIVFFYLLTKKSLVIFTCDDVLKTNKIISFFNACALKIAEMAFVPLKMKAFKKKDDNSALPNCLNYRFHLATITFWREP